MGLFSKQGSRSSWCSADIWAKGLEIIDVPKNTPGTAFTIEGQWPQRLSRKLNRKKRPQHHLRSLHLTHSRKNSSRIFFKIRFLWPPHLAFYMVGRDPARAFVLVSHHPSILSLRFFLPGNPAIHSCIHRFPIIHS